MAQTLEEVKMAHEVPTLPYDYTALEPTIDEKTMHLHHDMHHAAYVKNLNAALDKHPELHKKTAEDLIRDLNAIPENIRGPVPNNDGRHATHPSSSNTIKRYQSLLKKWSVWWRGSAPSNRPRRGGRIHPPPLP